MVDRTTLLSLLTAAAAFLPVAATSAQADDLAVSFKFDASSKCSRVSPEIKVETVPAGTVAFKVRLKDRNVPTWNHGGGKVAHDGSGVIPKGALKEGYNGPCPPGGSHIYVFTVKAVDANDEVLAEGEKSQRFP